VISLVSAFCNDCSRAGDAVEYRSSCSNPADWRRMPGSPSLRHPLTMHAPWVEFAAIGNKPPDKLMQWSAIVSRLSTTTPRSCAESTILTTEPIADRESADIVPRAQPQYLGLGRIQTQSACSHPRHCVSKTTREPVNSTLNIVHRHADVELRSSGYYPPTTFLTNRTLFRSRFRCVGIQGHAMYMDEKGDTEANYTVLALFTNHSVNCDDLQHHRTMRPVGYFRTGKLTSPVSDNAKARFPSKRNRLRCVRCVRCVWMKTGLNESQK